MYVVYTTKLKDNKRCVKCEHKSCGIKVGSLLLGQKYPVRPRALDQFLPRHSCVTDRFISDISMW